MGEFGHVVEGAHVAAILEDRHGIADAEYFLHAMRHVEHHPALVAQLGDDGHQAVDFPSRQAAGRLIERDHVSIARHRLGNLHQLPLAQGQAAQTLARIDLVGQPGQQLARATQHGGMIDQTETRWHVAQQEVFGNAHFRDQVQFLMDDRHAAADAFGGGLEDHRLPA